MGKNCPECYTFLQGSYKLLHFNPLILQLGQQFYVFSAPYKALLAKNVHSRPFLGVLVLSEHLLSYPRQD